MASHPSTPHEAAAVPEKAAMPQQPAVPLLLALAQSNANLDAADAAVFVRFTEEKIPLVQRISIIQALRSGQWGAWGSDSPSPTSRSPGDLEKAEPCAQPARPWTRRRSRHDWLLLLIVACLLLVGAAHVYGDLFRCHATKQ